MNLEAFVHGMSENLAVSVVRASFLLIFLAVDSSLIAMAMVFDCSCVVDSNPTVVFLLLSNKGEHFVDWRYQIKE